MLLILFYLVAILISLFSLIIIITGETSIQIFSKAKLFFLYKNHKNFNSVKNIKDNIVQYIFASLVASYIIHAILNLIVTYLLLNLNVSILYNTFIVTSFIIILEILTKKIALSSPEKVILTIGPIYIFVIKLFIILAEGINKCISSVINSVFNFKEGASSEDEEILSIIELKMEKKENKLLGNMIQNILHIKKIYVEDVMTCKNNIIYVDFNKKIQAITDSIKDLPEKNIKKYIPLWDEKKKNFIGLINTTKLFFCMVRNNVNFYTIMDEMFFIPAGTNIYKTLTIFKKKKIKFAFVVNEYGEIIGIVTLKDLLEEIVGNEIFEEEDEDKKHVDSIINPHNKKVLIVESDVSVKILNNYFNIDFFSEETYSINDIILNHLKRIPDEGDRILINNITFIILDKEDNKIQKVLVSLYDNEGNIN
jgi:Mg2+/Co2+ transporter CorB